MIRPIPRHCPPNDRPAGPGPAPRRPGFTLIEMMAAVAVTLILIVAINQVFSNVTSAIAIGKATTEIFGTSRILQEQLSRDFEQMVGPKEGGFLFILKTTTSQKLLESDTTPQTLHIDQMAFIRRRGSLEPMTPGNTTSFANSSDAAYCRVWLGHIVVNSAGSARVTEFGSPAIHWVLGRQALFLDPYPENQAGADSRSVVAQGFLPQSPVKGFGGKLADGSCDVAAAGLRVVQKNAPSAMGALVGATWVSGPKKAWLYENYPGSAYATLASMTMYGGTSGGTSGRLQAAIPDSENPANLTSEAIGKTHAYFAANVSDFDVEFAGDYNGDHAVDVNADGTIRWYNERDKPTFKSQTASPVVQGNFYVFRHGSGPTNWPYLLRLRYRIHDSKGRAIGSDGSVGYWFEQVVPIPHG